MKEQISGIKQGRLRNGVSGRSGFHGGGGGGGGKPVK